MVFSFEFAVYYGILCYVYLHALPRAGLSLADTCHKTPHCFGRLSHGWLAAGSSVDLSDQQWRDFRSNLPVLAFTIVVFTLVSGGLIRRKLKLRPAQAAPRIHLAFHAVAGVGYVSYLHGARAVFPIALALFGFVLGRAFGGRRRVAPVVTWVYALVLLAVKEHYHRSLRFAALPLVGPELAWLDRYSGVYGWHSSFNLVILRIVSFNMDMHWSMRTRPEEKGVGGEERGEGGRGEEEEASYKQLVRRSRPPADYATVVGYLAYCFYMPLYLSGPTITYNAFAAQVASPQRTYTTRQTARYALRLLASLALLEVGTHYFPCFAIVSSGAYRGLTRASEIGSLGFIALTLIWLKFLVIWRFARLWALCDGVETVENMNRCMHNNYSLTGFWRSWHRSFNQWLIRYLYVPLGGRRYRLANVWVVFTFVALWHDVESKLIAWGILCAFLILVEKAVRDAARARMDCGSPLYRHVCAAGGALYIYALIFVNLIGFSTGIGGMRSFVERLGEDPLFLACGYAFFFALTQAMFVIRDRESRALEKPKAF